MVRRDAWPACGSPRYTTYGHMHNGKQPSQCKACGRQWGECSAQYLMEFEPRAIIERLLLERIALRGMCRAVGVGLEG
jgi:heterodisulfide reductase subunit C